MAASSAWQARTTWVRSIKGASQAGCRNRRASGLGPAAASRRSTDRAQPRRRRMLGWTPIVVSSVAGGLRPVSVWRTRCRLARRDRQQAEQQDGPWRGPGPRLAAAAWTSRLQGTRLDPELDQAGGHTVGWSPSRRRDQGARRQRHQRRGQHHQGPDVPRPPRSPP